MDFCSDDDTIPKDSSMKLWSDALKKSCELAGFEDVPTKLEQYLKDAGFVDVRVTLKKLPLGPWPKDAQKKVSVFWGWKMGGWGANWSVG